MILDALFEGDSPREFLADVLHKRPYSRPGGAKTLRHLGAWERVREMFDGGGDVDYLLARDGGRYEGPPPAGVDEIRRLHDQGYTLGIRQAERHDAGIAELAEGFRRAFRGPVNVHLYATPAGQHGFGWHYDAEDVFILQTEGAKEFSLRKNTVNPWPTVETLPADMRFEREIMPVMKCRLEAGDWLYIPCGYWHVARAETDTITLAVGVLSATPLDALDRLRRQLLDSLFWRQRLPVPAHADDQERLLDEYRRLFSEAAADLTKRLADEKFLREFLDR